MNAVKGRAGKCSNFGNCSLADARTTQEIPAGKDFECGECGKPLMMVGLAETAKGNRKTGIMIAALVLLLLVGGAVAWSLSKGTPAPEPAVQAPAAQPVPVVPPLPTPAAAPAPLPPESGNCSDADAKVGLCRRKE